jgi:hypothetical protein
MAQSNRRTFVRETVIAVMGIVALYAPVAVGVEFRPALISGYLLIVGFDILEVTVGSAGAYYPVLFGAYLLGLGVAGAVVGHTVRSVTNEADLPSWRLGVAGAFTVVGGLSLVFALGVCLGTSQMAPVVITGTTGLFLLALAGWLAGQLTS